jgi:hypothetical protein
LGERTAGWRSPGLLIRIVYALCLAGATYNHVRAVMEGGWIPAHLPLASAIYWSSLTFLDPLAAVLLFVRPRAGIALTAAIIGTNVPHNLGYLWVHGEAGSFLKDVASNFMVMSQCLFLLFVAVTAPIAWRATFAGEQRPVTTS